MGFIRMNTEAPLDKGNTVPYQQLIDLSGQNALLLRAGRVCMAEIHHHEHLFALSLSKKIVHDQIDLTLPDPAGLVFAAAMEQIKHGISLIQIFLVSRRSIDPAITQGAGIRGAVIFTSHRAVGNVLEIVKIKFRVRHIYKIAQPVVGVADGSMLIQMLLPIEEVIKELHAAGDSGNNRLPPAFPLRLM